MDHSKLDDKQEDKTLHRGLRVEMLLDRSQDAPMNISKIYSLITDFSMQLSQDICRRLELDDFWFQGLILNADIVYEGSSSLLHVIDMAMKLNNDGRRPVIAVLTNDILETRIYIGSGKAGIAMFAKDAVYSCVEVFDVVQPEKIKGEAMIGLIE